MDFCPECGVAVDVEQRGGVTVYICRNPQCGQFGNTIDEKKEDRENG